MPLNDSNKTYGDDESFVVDVLNKQGNQGSLVVGTVAVEVKVSANRLPERKSLTLHNNSNSTIYWGYTSGVTSTTGTPIFRNQFITWEVGDQISIFVIAESSGNNTRVTEGA